MDDDVKAKKLRELLTQKAREYQQVLESKSEENIRKACELLQACQNKVKAMEYVRIEEQLATLDIDTKAIFELMWQYQKDIKELFTDLGETLAHVTKVSPENMIGGRIKKSIHRENHYKTERCDWVFASSVPMNGKNPYFARDPDKGLVLFAPKSYIYGGDIMKIQYDEKGSSRVILKRPNYIYKVDPKNFTPVVTLLVDKNGKPYFHFSEEWVSTEDIDINDPKQVWRVEKISDVTGVIENFQVVCAENIREVAKLDGNSRIEVILEGIKNGSFRYINGEAGINVSEVFQNARIEQEKSDTETGFVQE